MKSTSKLLSLLTVSIALAACGGGGSGGGSTPSVQPKPIPPKETNVVTEPIKEQLRELPIGKVKNEDVGFGVVTGYNNKYSFNGAWKEVKNKDELTEVRIDETKLSLANKFAIFGGLKGMALSEVFKSAWNVLNDDGRQRDVFYFGYETPVAVIDNQRGKAVYKGRATRYDNVKKDLSQIGTAILSVDFDKKIVSGEIDTAGIRRNISLKRAPITGNSFNGRATAGENNILFRTVEGDYEGKFFGPNAEEVAGNVRFNGEALVGKLSDLDTSFSAEKQSKK